MPRPNAPSPPASPPSFRREVLQIVLLSAVAVAAFFGTRAAAANARDMGRRDAAEWYRRGQAEVAAGHLDGAVDALRRANVKSRDNRTYMAALANAEMLRGDSEAARTILLTLRDASPEDPAINLQLARLARDRHDPAEALRFYRSALYAPWPADSSHVRRDVRLELVRFLLGEHRLDQARSELLAASADLPDAAADHVELASLFAQAGDDGSALSHYQQALRADADDRRALAGAGQAAFRLNRYVLARQYLHRATLTSAADRETRDVVDMVLTRDALAPRLGAPERRRRLESNIEYVQQRAAGCLESAGTASGQDARDLLSELSAFATRLVGGRRLEQDDIENGAELIDRAERVIEARCGPPTPTDRALLLIGQQHAGEAR